MNTSEIETKALDTVQPGMARFDTLSGELMIGGVPLSRLTARVGQSPFYAYDRELIRKRVEEFRLAMPNTVELHYAVKANPMPAIVARLAECVDGLDVASAGELLLALNTGMAPLNISFAGPGKRRSELMQAAAAGVIIIIESFREFFELREIQNETRWSISVAVRVNPDFEIRGSGMKMGGGAKQFGVDAEVVPQLLSEIHNSKLDFVGFHMFWGSQNLNAQAIAEAQTKSYQLAHKLANDAQVDIRFLNLGGGFGIPYFAGDKSLNLNPIATNIETLVQKAKIQMPEAKLIIELGRYLVGEAGVYVCKVLDRKVSRGQTFLVVDGGLHQHLAASGNLGQLLRGNYPLSLGVKRDSEHEIVSIVGPLCTPLDTLGHQVTLPRAVIGDTIVIYQSGAYGASASPQAFLGHPSVREILV